MEDSGRDPSGQALVASDQAASRLAPVGFDPSRIRVRTARDDILGVVEQFRQQHGSGLDSPSWRQGFTKRQIYEALLALNLETATREEVDAIIGNTSWIGEICEFCGAAPEMWFELGDVPDYEARYLFVCPPCLEHLGAIAAGSREGRDVKQARCEASQSGGEAVSPTLTPCDPGATDER